MRNPMRNELWDDITDPLPNFNCCTGQVYDWMNDFIPHFMIDVITYPFYYYFSFMLVKGALDLVWILYSYVSPPH